MTTRPATAVIADSLTASRFAMALGVALLLSAEALDLAAATVIAAWLSDMGDGRLARRAGFGTRLGHLDLPADVAVATGVMIGLSASGRLAWAWTFAGLGLVAVAAWRRNPSPTFIVMGSVDLVFILLVWEEGTWSRWPLLVAPLVALLVDGRRLFSVVIPAFLSTALTLLRGRSVSGRTLDEIVERD